MKPSLKKYMLASIVLVAGSVGYFCFRQIDHVMNEGLRSIQQKQIESIFQIASSNLNAVKDELQRGSRVLRSDNDLASAFVLSTETKDAALILEKLKHLETKMALDYLDILTTDGHFVSGDFEFLTAPFLQNLPGQEGFLLRDLDSAVFIYFVSPLELYGEKVGTLVLGRNLQASLQPKIADLTGAEISFSLRRSSNFSEEPTTSVKELLTESAQPLFAEAQLKSTQFDSIIALSRKNLLIWLGIGFLILILSIYILFERGLLKNLNSLLGFIHRTSDSIDQGKIPAFQIPTYAIKEIDVVAKAFGKVVGNLETYDRKIKDQTKREAEIEKDLAVADLAKQVAHDIRSPIGTLEGVLKHAEAGRFEFVDQTGKNAIQLIKDIADTLDPDQSLESKEKVQRLAPLIEEVVCELRIKSTDVQFVVDVTASKNLAAKIQSVEFKRILTNIINNGIEALRIKNREIRISLCDQSPEFLLLEVADSGIGIDEHLLPELGKLGVSVGKPKGRGRGLYHAKHTIGRWSGALEILSKKGIGTAVRIQLPRAEILSMYGSDVIILSEKLEDEKAPLDLEASVVDLVLIDNMKYTRDSWSTIAKRLKLKCLCLNAPNDKLLTKISTTTPIFIDLNLDHGISGFDVASKLAEKGFENLFITTGNVRVIEESRTNRPHFVLDVTDKQFPWWIKDIGLKKNRILERHV